MRVGRRCLGPNELDHELIWLSVSLGGLALAAMWFTLRLPWPHCIFLAITGHPCLTCGATRASIAFFHLDFSNAWKWNPLFFCILCLGTLFDVYAFAVLVLRAPRLRIVEISGLERKSLRALVIALLLANWIYLLSRGPGLY
jgi:Protein of unknown function (DUF2752)